jgi:hypothetical protein
MAPLRLIFRPQIFLNGAFILLSYVFWNLDVREKKFLLEKHKIFLFQVFDLRFFTQISFYSSVDPNPYPNPNFFSDLDSDPAKTFGFGSTTRLLRGKHA